VQNRTIVKAGRRLAGGSDYRALTPEKGKGRRERSLKDSLEAWVSNTPKWTRIIHLKSRCPLVGCKRFGFEEPHSFLHFLSRQVRRRLITSCWGPWTCQGLG
jgi:hypothetical protein